MKRFIFLLAALLMLCAANASGTQVHNNQYSAGYSVAQPPGCMVADYTFETSVTYIAQTLVQTYSYEAQSVIIQEAVMPDANLLVNTRATNLHRHYISLHYTTYCNYSKQSYIPPVNLHIDPGSCRLC